MRDYTSNHRGFTIQYEYTEESDNCYWDATVHAGDKYLATYPYPIRFSNGMALVRKWIDDNFRLLTACK